MTISAPSAAPAHGTIPVTVTVATSRSPLRRYVALSTSADGTTFTPLTRWRVTGRGIRVTQVPTGAAVGRLYVRATLNARAQRTITRTVNVRVTNPYRPSVPDNADIPEEGVPVATSLFGNHPVVGVPEAAGTVRLWDTGTSWNQVEVGRGVYDWARLDRQVAQAEANGQEVMLVLGGTPSWAAVGGAPGAEFAGPGSSMPMTDASLFEDYVRAVVQRYGGRIRAYQIWNEANIDQFWRGTPELMADLTARAYRQIKAAQPSATVVAASTGSRWIKGFTDFYPQYLTALGNVGWPIDAFSVHLYPKADGTPLDRIFLLGLMRTALRIANAPVRPIWETEINYGVTNPGLGDAARAIPDVDIPGYVARTYVDSLRYGIARSYWYAWTPDYRLLGIQMFTNYPASHAYRTIRDWLVGATFHGCSTTGVLVECNFDRAGAAFHVAYTDDDSATSLPAPAGFTTVTALDGVTTPITGPVTVTGTPVRLS
jgi:hypothetical protein